LYNSWTNGIHSIPCSAYSNAAVFVNRLRHAAGSPSKPTRPAKEQLMVPLPCMFFQNFMLHAEPNPFQVYGNGFIPIFLCTISRGESPSIPALLKA
jgi:hypothetical protein